MSPVRPVEGRPGLFRWRGLDEEARQPGQGLDDQAGEPAGALPAGFADQRFPYFFGVLHSRVHEVWAREQGTQVRERESGFRYTPTTCFETFPFPEPTADQVATIGAAAKELEERRSRWLNPPEWVREEILEFPGSVDGPWGRYVVEPDARGVGTVRYPRLVPRDAFVFDLGKRTLTNLYNEPPTWLDLAHRRLDEAVFAAYGWSPSIDDDGLLAALLDLNLARPAVSGKPAPAEPSGDADEG